MTMKTHSRVLHVLAILMALSVLPSCKQSDQTGAETPTSGNTDTSGGETGSPAFEPIQISAAPQNQAGYPGQTVRFTVTATSNTPLNYQWFHNDAAIAGATASSFAVTINGATSAGAYRVDVSNSSTATSALARLQVNSLPAITSPPAAQLIYPSDTASFSVGATGTDITYQWQQKSGSSWTSLAGATGSTLVLANVDKSRATDYRAVVSNGGGSATSASASLSLKEPVTITLQPVSKQSATGQDVTFTIRATGHGELYYRWYKGKYAIYNSAKYDGTPLPTLTIHNVEASDASLYQVKVFNDDKKFAFSSTAQLSVAGPAKVTVQPENTSLYSGKPGSLLIAASGDQPLTYQWQKWSGSSWQNLSGATSAALNFASATSATAGRYRCQVSNAVAQDTSAEATVTLLQSAALTRTPASQTVSEGTSVQFVLAATGDNLSYEWTKNGQVISTSGTSLSLASARKVDEATYGCRVYNGGGSVSCPSFSLTVSSPLAIVTQPVSQNTYEGGSATLSVVASGDPAPTVDWYFGGKLVGTGSSLTLNNIQASQAGEYQCVVKNSTGTLNCNKASITVSQSVKITGQPASTTGTAGAALTLTLSAVGESLNYDWSKNGTSLGINSSSLSFSSLKASDEGTYSCRIWNSTSSANCNSFTLTVNQAPTITTQPAAASAFEDGSVTLSVTATGKPTPTVNWYFNGAVVKSNANTLTLSKLTLAQAGSYQCVVTNSVGTANCTAATVTVREKVRITKQLSNQLLNDGDNILLSLAATGELPITYKCYKGTQLMVTSTKTAELIIPSASSSDSGSYHCVASNAGSSATTSTITISVAASATTGSAQISWTQPTRRANGDALSSKEIAGYEIYMASSAAGPFATVMTAESGESSALITDLSPGTYYFGISTLDTNGLESDMSSVIKVTID